MRLEQQEQYTFGMLIISFLSHRGPFVTNDISIIVTVYEGILTFFVFAMFAHATFRDPGVLPRGKQVL